MQGESVVWISERKNLLSSLFIFLSLWFYLRYAMSFRFRRIHYYFCLLSFSLALLSKSISVMFPCVLVLLDILVLKRKMMVMEKIPFFAVPSCRTGYDILAGGCGSYLGICRGKFSRFPDDIPKGLLGLCGLFNFPLPALSPVFFQWCLFEGSSVYSGLAVFFSGPVFMLSGTFVPVPLRFLE